MSKSAAKIQTLRMFFKQKSQEILKLYLSLGFTKQILLYCIIIAIVILIIWYHSSSSYLHSENKALNNIRQVNNPFYIITQNSSLYEHPKKENIVIYDNNKLTQVWSEIHSKYKPPAPAIDFNQYIVVGLFAGLENTDGYTISVDKISYSPTSLTIIVKYTVPSCIHTYNPTTPYEIIKIPKTTKPILFQTEPAQKQCQK